MNFEFLLIITLFISSMPRLNILSCALALVALTNAIVIPLHHEVHEKRETLAPRWAKRGRVEEHKLLSMRIGLTQANVENGYEHLMDV